MGIRTLGRILIVSVLSLTPNLGFALSPLPELSISLQQLPDSASIGQLVPLRVTVSRRPSSKIEPQLFEVESHYDQGSGIILQAEDEARPLELLPGRELTLNYSVTTARPGYQEIALVVKYTTFSGAQHAQGTKLYSITYSDGITEVFDEVAVRRKERSLPKVLIVRDPNDQQVEAWDDPLTKEHLTKRVRRRQQNLRDSSEYQEIQPGVFVSLKNSRSEASER